MNDREIGLKVLKSFYNWSKHYNGSTFKLSFNEFLVKLQPNAKKLDIALDGIGGGVRESEISDSRVNDAMMKMAIQAKGKIPSSIYDFFKYLTNEAVKISYSDAALYVAAESLKDIGSAAESIGNSIISTGKIVNFLLPAIGLFFLFSYMNKASGGDLSKAFGALRK